MVRETRKILHDDEIRCTVTCVRVPVYVGHAVTANVRFHRPMRKAEAVELLRDAPGVLLVDDGDGYPTPQEAAGIDPVLVGPGPGRPVRARIDRPVGHRRQPAQGRGAERRADGGAPARAVAGVTGATPVGAVRDRKSERVDISNLAAGPSIQSLLATPATPATPHRASSRDVAGGRRPRA